MHYYVNSSLTSCLSSGYNITKPTKDGYRFDGYYTVTNGGGTQYVNADGTFINNIYQKLPSEINSSYNTDVKGETGKPSSFVDLCSAGSGGCGIVIMRNHR